MSFPLQFQENTLTEKRNRLRVKKESGKKKTQSGGFFIDPTEF